MYMIHFLNSNTKGGNIVNKDIFEGKWDQVKGNVQKNWGKLTDDDMDVIKGNTTILAGKIQEKYGITKDEAEKEIDKFDI